MRWRLIAPGVVLTLLPALVGCGGGVEHAATYPVTSPDSRPAAPAFVGVNTRNRFVQLYDLGGRVVLVNLEFPGNVNAQVQRAEITAASAGFSRQDFASLRVKQPLGPVRRITAVVQGFIVSLPDQVGLHERRQAITLGLSGLPYLLVVDRRGRVATRIAGVVDPARLRATITQLSAEA